MGELRDRMWADMGFGGFSSGPMKCPAAFLILTAPQCRTQRIDAPREF